MTDAETGAADAPEWMNEAVAVVTGAAGGIGTALVDQFRSEGATVIGSDLKVPELTQANRFLTNDI